MKTTTLLLLFILFSSLGFTQNISSRYAVPITPPTPMERYGIDYELKDYIFINGDSTVLNQLDLNSIEQYRSMSEDVEIIDSNTGLTIILFYEKRQRNTNYLNQKL